MIYQTYFLYQLLCQSIPFTYKKLTVKQTNNHLFTYNIMLRKLTLLQREFCGIFLGGFPMRDPLNYYIDDYATSSF
jgi:hypothetical protein